MDRPAIDARKLVERLRREAAAEGLVEREGELPERPPSDHVQHRLELAEVNRRYLLPGPIRPPVPEEGGLRGAFRRRVVQLAADVVLAMLEKYFADERELLTPLVRFQNELAKKADRLEDEIREVTEATRRELHVVGSELRRLAERIETLHALVEARVDRLEGNERS